MARQFSLLKILLIALVFMLILFVTTIVVRRSIILNKTISGQEFFTDKAKTELLQRRAFLIEKIKKGDYNPQKMPPVGTPFQHEWSIVATSMTAMALADLSFRFPETREESVEYIDSLITLLLSDDMRVLGETMWQRDPLDEAELHTAQAWYMAHAGLTIAAYKYCSGDDFYDSIYTVIHEATVKTLERSSTPYIETYPGQIYTADNAALYASLMLYDELMGKDNKRFVEQWISYTEEKLIDSETGVMKSYVTNINSPSTNSRGSWAGWNSYYLPLVDSSFARAQYLRTKEHFLDNLFGFRVCLEYPHGVSSSGDIDSGPVIFGASTSGTVFLLGGAVRQKDYDLVGELLKTYEFAGISRTSKGKRHYLLAPLVGDAIALAMMTATTWDLRYQKQESQ